MKRIFYACIFPLSIAAMASDEGAPKNIFGIFEKTHQIFFNCENPPKNKEYCSRWVTDKIVIKHSKNREKYRSIEAEIYSVGVNGHTCGYEGSGYWNNRARRLQTSVVDGENECTVIFIFHGDFVQTVVQNHESCRDFCGSGNGLDGYVFKRR